MEYTLSIELTQEQLQNMGADSLEGLITKEIGKYDYEIPSKVLLVFPQKSLRWKKENNGPDILMVPEHTIPTLLESVMSLVENGWNIHISMPVDK